MNSRSERHGESQLRAAFAEPPSPRACAASAIFCCALALSACGSGGTDPSQGTAAPQPIEPVALSGDIVVAPSILTGPTSLEASSGNWVRFNVDVKGTAPLAFQWFVDGEAIANANSGTLQLKTADLTVGERHKIAVEVSNSAGRVQSESAILYVGAPDPATSPNPNVTEVLVSAASGGVVSLSDSEEAAALIVPAGALQRNTRIRFAGDSAIVSGLPAGMVPMGETISISGVELVFASGARLSFPAPEDLPEGHVLAVLAVPPTTAPGLSVPFAFDVRCVTAQDIQNGDIQLDVSAAGSWVLAAVWPDQCTSHGTYKGAKRAGEARNVMSARLTRREGIEPAAVPRTSTVPCTQKEWESLAEAGLISVSRHVECRYVQDDHIVYDLKTGDWLGEVRFELRLVMHGPSNRLSKKVDVSARAYWKDSPVPGKGRPSTIPSRIEIECAKVGSAGEAPNCLSLSLAISPQSTPFSSSESGWSRPKGETLKINWENNEKAVAQIRFPNLKIHFTRVGGSLDALADRQTHWSTVPFSEMRCDSGFGGSTLAGGGCVFHHYPAVLGISLSDPKVAQSSRHIQDAQASGKPGAYGWSGLRRSWMPGLADLNRNASCAVPGPSVIVSKPSAGGGCPNVYQPGSKCDCDEYPFAATWEGGYRGAASARYIPAGDNRSAGARLGVFFRRERVLDQTPEAGGVNASDILGDEFWIHIVN